MSPVSAPWTLAWFDEWAPIVQTFTVVVTGGVAIRGLSSWRAQMVGKRKAELAEQVLTAFYEARDAIRWARAGGFFEHEGKSRKAADDEPEQVRLMRNAYFVPIERLVSQKELFARIKTQGYIFRAYFGEPAMKPFQVLGDAYQTIMSAASVLVQMAVYDGAAAAATPARENLLNELGWGRQERPDDMDKALDKALADMEATCRPVLEARADRSKWPLPTRMI